MATNTDAPVVIASRKANKQLVLRLDRGRRIRLIREVYLRSSVPCYSDQCRHGCPPVEGHATLAAGLSHYVMPDCAIARAYWELFELPGVEGVVLTLTSLHYMQGQGGRRLYNRVKSELRDPRQSTVLFDNEFQADCWRDRRPREAEEAYQTDLNCRAALWYARHLDYALPIVLVTDSPVDTGEQPRGVEVLSVADYVSRYHGDKQQVTQIFESLRASLTAAAEGGGGGSGGGGGGPLGANGAGGDFEEHLPAETLKAGVKSGQFLQGCLHVSRRRATGQDAAIVTLSQGSQTLELKASRGEILVLGQRDRNRAVHGDIVCVQLLPRSNWCAVAGTGAGSEAAPAAAADEGSAEAGTAAAPTGRIVGVMQRNWRDYVCSVEPPKDAAAAAASAASAAGAKRILAVPWDHRVPKIRIATSQAAALANQRFVARIDAWPADSQYPSGHFVRPLGPVGDLETETQTLLIEHGLAVREFSERQLAELPTVSESAPWHVDPQEVARRRDLRQTHLVFSIDPIGCVDVDDTLSVRRLDNGNIELGVHIADVTHFVKANSLCDIEARQRCTSIYLADRRYDMLPLLLSGNLCSLWSQVDRYAVSVIWELTPDTEVVNVWYGRTVIRSAYKLFYEMAQRLHDGEPLETAVPDIPELAGLSDRALARRRFAELREAVSLLVRVADTIKARRMLSGGLELEGVEVQAKFSDPNRTQLEDLVPKAPLQMHEVIAECMIFANHWVARKILAYYPSQSCLRRHPPPRQEFFDSLIRCAQARGFSVEVDSNRKLAESLDKCVDPSDPEVNRILRTLATQAMSNALYFSTGCLPREQFAHYGLALDLYTHFTSPIRRYADILVHRCLLAALGDPTAEAELLTNQELEAQCALMNERHRMAQHVQMGSMQLFQCLFFRAKPAEDPIRLVEAVVCQIRDTSFTVFVPRFGIRGTAHVVRKDGSVLDAGQPAPDLRSVQTGTWPIASSRWVATGGTAVRDATDGRLRVTAPGAPLSPQVYGLFDHVVVKVTVSESHSHGLSLQLDLVARLVAKGTAPTSQQQQAATAGKAQLVRDVQELAAEEQLRAAKKRRLDDAPDGGDAAGGGGQQLHSAGTVYHLMLYRMQQQQQKKQQQQQQSHAGKKKTAERPW